MKKLCLFLCLIVLLTGCSSEHAPSSAPSTAPPPPTLEEVSGKAELAFRKIIDEGASAESLAALSDITQQMGLIQHSSQYPALVRTLNEALLALSRGENPEDIYTCFEQIKASPEHTAYPLFTGLEQHLLIAACTERYKMKDHLILTFGGDCSFGTYPQAPEETKFDAVMAGLGEDLSYPLYQCRAFFNTDTLTILNNETAITTRTEMVKKEWQIKSDPKYTPIYTLAGVDAVNLANNHTRDCFEDGYEDTLASLRQNNLKFFDDGQPLIHMADGIELVFLGYEMRMSQASDNFRDRIVKDIKKYKKTDNFVFVSIHWGIEYREQPVAYQSNYGRAFIDAGADAVIGAHPHIMEGIELYKGKYLIYSMGDFCFGGDPELLSRMTALFRFYIHKESRELSLHLVPFYENSDGAESGHNDFRPLPLFGAEARPVIDYLKRICNPLSHGLSDIPVPVYVKER